MNDNMRKECEIFSRLLLLSLIVYFAVGAFFLFAYVPFLRWLKADIAYTLPSLSDVYLYAKTAGLLAIISSIGLWVHQKFQRR